MTNYYKLLELPDFATGADIKAAHRRLSKKYHPDMNSGDKYSEEKFKEIQDAYDHLSDAGFKAAYDDRLRGHYYNYGLDEEASTAAQYTSTPTRPTFGEALRKVPVLVWVLGTMWMVKGLSYAYRSSDNDFDVNFTHSSESDSILKVFASDSILMHALAAQPYDTGASTADVRTTQGTPTLIERTPAGDIWYYGNSKLLFKDGRVTAYDNIDGNLFVKDSVVGFK